jgi:hypothetical protein
MQLPDVWLVANTMSKFPKGETPRGAGLPEGALDAIWRKVPAPKLGEACGAPSWAGYRSAAPQDTVES